MSKAFFVPLTVSAVAHVAPVAYFMVSSESTLEMKPLQTYRVELQQTQEQTAPTPQAQTSAPSKKATKKIKAVLKEDAPHAPPPPLICATPKGTNRQPDYPVEAREKGLEGVITLKLVVDEKGDVSHIYPKDTPTKLTCLKEAAIKAAKSWRFDVCGLASGQTVDVEVPFEFKLADYN